MRLTHEELAQVKAEVTEAQYAAIELWATGFGYKRIGLVLHIDPSTAKARIAAGLKKIGLSIEAVR